jgi:4-amino-4-deoxy-L-arabinose transferase-like glycosyltransferase
MPSARLGWVLALLLTVAVGLFFWRLGQRDLWSSHEARAAMNASRVLAGDALPRLHDGRAETQKPPLYYWLVAAAGWLRGGVDEVATRLPATLAALAVTLLVVLIPARMGRPLVGLTAGLILATGVHFPWLARIARIDVPLALVVTIAVLAFFGARRVGRSWRVVALVIAWLACAAGVLLKGPIGLALPAAVVAAWLLLEGRWPAFWELPAWRCLLGELGVCWGVPLVLLVCVPVFVWLEYRSGGTFCHDFFWLHNVQRGLGGSRLRGHPWWLYVPYLMLYLLPYSPLLFAAFWRRWWLGDPLARLGLAWMLGVLLLLSAARFKRADYLLPAYPGAALFLGCLIARRRWAVGGVGIVAAVMLAGWVVRIGHQLPAEEPYRDYRPFAALVREQAPAPEEVIFFRGEAHALAFRVGRPLVILTDWEHLRQRIPRDGCHVVMPPDAADQVARRLPGVTVETLGGTEALAGGRHERPLVLVRLARSGRDEARRRE